ncbi:MAG: hypothetical protein JWL73_2285 [Actinomycetia bacterium]|nr:hypothetical protein [Actinomycetes bacterium]
MGAVLVAVAIALGYAFAAGQGPSPPGGVADRRPTRTSAPGTAAPSPTSTSTSSVSVLAEQVTRPSVPVSAPTRTTAIRPRATATTAKPVVELPPGPVAEPTVPPPTTEPTLPVVSAAPFRPVGQTGVVQIGEGAQAGEGTGGAVGGANSAGLG